MKLLLELREEDIELISKHPCSKRRDAARAVLLKGNKIALIYVSRHGYHKLPGGGIEKGESIEDALFREIKEETGCKIKIIGEVGKIIEHRTHFNLLQTSYCFLAKVIEEDKPEFDKGELGAGYKLGWTTIDQAIKLLRKEPETKDKLENYLGKFIIKRDLRCLEEAQKIINSNKQDNN